MYLAACSAVASVRLINLQVNVLRSGGRVLVFQAFFKIRLALGSILLEPWGGKGVI